MNNIDNLTAVFHQERIPDTKILTTINGHFMPVLPISSKTIRNNLNNSQLCFQFSNRIDIYGFKSETKEKTQNNSLPVDENINLIKLNSYKIFDTIETCDKFTSLLNNKDLNSIVLALSSYKISFIEYNALFDTFNTLALYAIGNFYLSGKITIEKYFKLIPSLTYKYLVLIYDENKLGILRKKFIGGGVGNKKSGGNSINYDEKLYTDTMNGDKYFLPSIYLNDLNIKYNIEKIINIYLPKKNSENLIFNPSFKEHSSSKEIEIIKIYILYIDSKPNSSENINTKNNETNSNEIETNNSININNFMREKVSLGLLSYNCKIKEYSDFQILFTDIDENAFDFTILEKVEKEKKDKNSNALNNTVIIFSAYNLQILKLKNKTSVNYILNINYMNIFSKIYKDFSKFSINQYFINNNLDLRGGGFLVIESNCFIFSDSKGALIYTNLDENTEHFELLSIETKNNTNCLGAPYNKILMPFPFIFFLSSPYADGIILAFSQNSNNYKIKDKLINYSPIVNFHLVNDMNSNTKFAFTSGYGENGKLSFAYDQFLFYSFIRNAQDFYDIDIIKSINIAENKYTKYLLCKLKNQHLIVFENKNNDLNNITSKIYYNKEGNILSFGKIIINNENDEEENKNEISIIVLIFENEIRFYDEEFNLLNSINNIAIDKNNSFNLCIKKAKLGENCILFSNNDNKFYLLGLYNKNLPNNINNNIIEIKINQNIYIRIKDITNLFNNTNSNSEITKYNINSKLYLKTFIFLMIYRNNQTLEIYDLTNCLSAADNNSSNDNNISHNNTYSIKKVLSSNLINYCPTIILNDSLNKNLLYRSASNYNIDFSKNIDELFGLKNNNDDVIMNNAIEPPDFIYFENLGNIIILVLTYKSGLLVIYSLYISEYSDNKENIKSVGLKKIIVENLTNVDYLEFFRLDLEHLFIKFENIDNKSGILFNLDGNRKIIYDNFGELCLMKINNNIFKSSFNGFSDFNSQIIPNGFIVSEGGLFKYCLLNYNLSHHSLLIKTINTNRFPVLMTYTPEYNSNMLNYNYIIIEKEMISPNNFIYYMVLRTEDNEQPICQKKFEINESITECNVIELPSDQGRNTKKYIAVGVNIISSGGEYESFMSKIQLYSKDKGEFELIIEKKDIKGAITMIQVYNKSFLLVCEGPRVSIYQFYANSLELKFLKRIENKNLAIFSRVISGILLTGDIINSLNAMYVKNKIDNNNNSIDIIELAKNNSKYKITSCDFWVAQNQRCFILFDEENNGCIYLMKEEINKNYTLLKLCDFKINKNINEIRSRKAPQNDSYLYYYSALDGSIGYISHIENAIYEKLYYLCEFIYFHFPFDCGVNPKSYYTSSYNMNFYQKSNSRYIDMKILEIFLNLSDTFQEMICNKVLGMEKNVILGYIKNLFT